MKDYSEYTIEDFQNAFAQYYMALTYKVLPSDNPKAFILGGQGGAGKATLHSILSLNVPNIVVIDGDRFREKHPNFEIIQRIHGDNAANYTQSFSNNIVVALIEKLSDEGYNLIIEGTCRRADVPMKTCNDLKEKGYHVELAVMCTDANVSWQSTVDRYNAMSALGLTPRAVPFDKYTETVNALPQNIETLYKSGVFDDIALYDRDRNCLYRFTESPDINPRDIVEYKLYEFSEQTEEDEDDLEM